MPSSMLESRDYTRENSTAIFIGRYERLRSCQNSWSDISNNGESDVFVQNPPKKHHYIPKFYTKRWADKGDGRLVVYSRPHQRVIDRRLFPDGTGYLEGLYALRDFEPALTNQVEENFFKPVDSQASEALAALERYGDGVKWDVDSRTAWTRFLLSLLLRCPEDLALLRAYWAEESVASDADSEAKYADIRQSDDPATFRDYLLSRPQWEHERTLFEMFQRFIDNETIGTHINQMHWGVIETSKSNLRLMTSDRLIVRSAALKSPQGHLALPVGPSLLFVAASNPTFLTDLRRTPSRDIVMQSNRTVMTNAVKFGYANDLSQRRFVESVFATDHEPRLLEGTVEKRRTTAPPRGSLESRSGTLRWSTVF